MGGRNFLPFGYSEQGDDKITSPLRGFIDILKTIISAAGNVAFAGRDSPYCGNKERTL